MQESRTLERIVFGLLVVGVAISMIAWLLRSASNQDDKAASRYYIRQRRRRILTAALIGLVGILIVVSSQVAELRLALYLYLTIMLLIFFIIGLAIVDSLRIRAFFLKNDQGVTEARDELMRELKRAQTAYAEKRREAAADAVNAVNAAITASPPTAASADDRPGPPSSDAQ